MTRFAVAGYASLDYCVRLDRAPRADATATIVGRPAEWPRLGGSPAYVASALVAGGLDAVAAVSWVGDDAEGRGYREALAARGVDVAGIASHPGRTPVCILAYQPDGGCHCFYDPSLAAPLALDPGQARLVAAADWVCLTVGPAEATAQALAAARPEARLVWAVKADRARGSPGSGGADRRPRRRHRLQRGRIRLRRRGARRVGRARPAAHPGRDSRKRGRRCCAPAGAKRGSAPSRSTRRMRPAPATRFSAAFSPRWRACPTRPRRPSPRGARAARDLLFARGRAGKDDHDP